ncbi:MAG: NAD-dependent epimerase/dehydratase family protein [Myxococcales bacterium]|nr:NAD-dependent epimerase/dehydratase family protein [Myxococcales bacterium]
MILVTGGAGHLGANLVRRLIADGHGGDIRALYRPASDNRALDGLPIELVAGDLRDLESLRAAVRGCDLVYHCAAKISTLAGSEREIFDCNVVGTRHLLLAAREAGAKKVVVSGSFSAVGHHLSRPSDESVPFYPFALAMPYEWTKALVEMECWRAAAAGLETVVATSCAIMGPHDYKPSRMGETLIAYAHRKLPAYIPGGFEFVSARDIVEGHILAMEKGRSGEKYIISTRYVTLDELMQIFQEVTGTPKPRFRLPPPLMAGIAAVASPIMSRFFPRRTQRLTPGAIRLLRMGRRADHGKAERDLGFRPTSMEEAVTLAYADFLRRGLIERPRRSVAFVDPYPAPKGKPAVEAAPSAGQGPAKVNGAPEVQA